MYPVFGLDTEAEYAFRPGDWSFMHGESAHGEEDL